MMTKTGTKPMPPPSNRPAPSGEETIMDLIDKFSGDESGATAVEYSLMLAFIALTIFVALKTFGSAVNGLFELANERFPSGS
jgi:Flp pilus assembly pilin Flp